MGKRHNTAFKHRLVLALIPLLTGVVRLVGMTMRISFVDPHGVTPFATPKPTKPLIYCFWHNQQILAAYFCRDLGIRVLISRSRDGEYIARIVEHLGFGTVRSSTSTGKVNALRGLVRELKAGHHVAITPDGPRGPVYRAQPGVVFLGSLSGHAVVPFGCATAPAWRLHSWDGFEIPKPFSKAAIVVGQAIPIPRKLSEDQVREWCAKIEQEMNKARDEARAMVGVSGD
jgi:lysophospholipid acyltransferase (LPLAT)-like uncharacterized protein